MTTPQRRPAFKRGFSRIKAETTPLSAVIKLAQRTQNNLRTWYTKKHYKQDAPERDLQAERAKSESLFAQCFLVAPMVLLAASGIELADTDERRVPVLLQQLSFTVADHGRNLRVRVEYGSGDSKFSWEIQRTHRDFLIFRAKLKTHRRTPRANVPKLPKRKREQGNYSSAIADWLSQVARAYMLRPDSNDFLQFIELSRLSVALAPEYAFHGKEGALFIRSRASEMGWHVSHLHPHDFRDMIKRHTRKWVLVRDSFLVIVSGIGSTRIRDVFTVDKCFTVKHTGVGTGEDDVASLSSVDSSSSSDVSTTVSAQSGPSLAGTHASRAQRSVVPSLAETNEDAAPDVAPDVSHLAINDAGASGGASREVSKKSVSARAPLVFLHLENGAREIKLASTSEHEIIRWQNSIMTMLQRTQWSNKQRFDSFAPVRQQVLCQWFVDARDYMWVLSEAIEHAQDTIYILDWWLSPELYLRRPPEGNQHFRLDRLLKRKAQQGVKIFVIVYRNVGPTIPNDSMWTKHSLLNLHPNIHVMRSPNQLQNKSALFWAHHEKVCVVDQTVAFCGGVDLCYGRWDSWQHVATDDVKAKFSTKDEPTQLFVGKDYGNERASDFHDLDHPYDDMFDRTKTPRMPWHDVHQMVVGQPARDLARHFVQRWNYVLRQKTPSRLTPLLLPPPDFTQQELERLQLTGTCEYQVLRSSGEWSLGLKEPEHSIQNCYVKLISESAHFIYIENQFFITSTVVDGIRIENAIGDAIVQRIVLAHERNERWQAFIVIPLLPGFAADVGSEKASSVRVICQCQFNSISRGPDSIFYRLERRGIRPEQYIRFFSLRKWGKFADGKLITELLYVHGKTMVVDDRIAVIGSANINERSMRGSRDSEIAVVVRDTQTLPSKMNGKDWTAARFAHSLRTRLMREHLGVDIDAFDVTEKVMEGVRKVQMGGASANTAGGTANGTANGTASGVTPSSGMNEQLRMQLEENEEQAADDEVPELDDSGYRHSFNWLAGTRANRGVRDYKKVSKDSRVQMNPEHDKDIDGYGMDEYAQRTTQALTNKQKAASSEDRSLEATARKIAAELMADPSIKSAEHFRLELYARLSNSDPLRPVPKAADIPAPQTTEDGLRALHNESIPIDPWGFMDPLDPHFVEDKWLAAADRNTLIYRLVFRCQPDDEVETWKDYKTFSSHQEQFMASQNNEQPTVKVDNLDQKIPVGSTYRNRRWANFDKVLNVKVAEELLSGITGNLVVFPTEWLNRELDSGNWNFQLDRIPPLEIYD